MNDLITDLIRFAKSKDNLSEKLKYTLLGLLYFIFILRNISKNNQNYTEPETITGDDIYPIF